MKRFFCYLFWKLVYAVRPQPNTIALYIQKLIRCRWPWKQFWPGLYHNEDGRFWEMYFTDEMAFGQTRTIEVGAEIGQRTGDIVGLKIWDETLKKKPSEAK